MILKWLFLSLCINYFIDKISGVNITRLLHNPQKEHFNIKEASELFQDYVQTFNKKYENDEYQRRYEIFVRNLKEINKRNDRSETIYGLTNFMDVSWNEYKGMFHELGYSNGSAVKLALRDVSAPEQLDWRKSGVVGPIKNQGSCFSCWAFSAVACVESQYAMKYKKMISLSEQQLVDCYKAGGGCRTGNYPHNGMRAAAQMGGFVASKDYPYQYRQGVCQFNRNKVAVKLSGGKQVNIRSEEELKKLVADYGPVSIGIHASGRGFQIYRGSIFHPTPMDCPTGRGADHAVLVVGYGIENSVPYWIIKNSASEIWGEGGYMRLVRGKNACSILQYAAIADGVI